MVSIQHKMQGFVDPAALYFFVPDYYPYAVLDLVDTTLTMIYNKITQKAYQDAYYLLEGLTLFNDFDLSWPMCDDGDRTKITDKAYGALVVATLEGFEKDGRLNATDLPGLENFLKTVAEWADSMKELSCSASYGDYCKSIGRKLFKNKSAETIAREKAWLDAWIAGLDVEDQQSAKKILEDAEKEPLKRGIWDAGRDDFDDMDFALSRVWKQYRQYLTKAPTAPLRGPGTWDISKWSEIQKEEFVFKGASDEEED
ncbi:hypothetical protein H0H81_011608 [Sphagnurus paluster]|uniref:Uncharacterized protein n=1 Tax=Sphagnurus paluster TaxID=117069 RepID=A0A9P7GUC3_9AGAR|nr:hypothetical protein H0H81_011608 [Sphagnurus paluster]